MVFGFLHGVYLTINHAWRIFTSDRPVLQRFMPFPVGMALTAAAVLVGQVFFRATSVSDAVVVLQGLLHLHDGVALAQGPGAGLIPYTSSFLLNPAKAAGALAACFAIVWFLPNTQEILGQAPRERLHHFWHIEIAVVDSQSAFRHDHGRVVYGLLRAPRRQQELPLFPILSATPFIRMNYACRYIATTC